LSTCQKDGQTLVRPGDDVTVGYLASTSATDHGGIGSSACPWRIQVTLVMLHSHRPTQLDTTVLSRRVGGVSWILDYARL